MVYAAASRLHRRHALGVFFYLCVRVIVPIDENEYIIGELANIIKDQNYRMQNDLRDAVEEYSPPEVPRKRFTADGDEKQPSFTYDLDSNLPEINTGDREVPFAVLPNDRRYYQTGSDGGGGVGYSLFDESVFSFSFFFFFSFSFVDRTLHADQLS